MVDLLLEYVPVHVADLFVKPFVQTVDVAVVDEAGVDKTRVAHLLVRVGRLLAARPLSNLVRFVPQLDHSHVARGDFQGSFMDIAPAAAGAPARVDDGKDIQLNQRVGHCENACVGVEADNKRGVDVVVVQ